MRMVDSVDDSIGTAAGTVTIREGRLELLPLAMRGGFRGSAQAPPTGRSRTSARHSSFRDHVDFHGSTRAIPVCSKSLTLRVANVAWWVPQMAAICASNPSMGSPR